MTQIPPDRWKRIRELFDDVMERPAAERNAYLTEASGEDDDLKREVESLLGAHVESDSLVGGVVRDAASRASAPLRVGTKLGPYRLIEAIGEGGMGSVYLAERIDEAYEMKVAIKVVRGGLDSARILERFHEERRILAALDHPNVARVLDGGSTGDGLPYLVMEHVAGRRIDEYCDEKRLDIRDRIALFRSICSAVEHAHRQLVVHRDIKPANVLVTGDGIAKLLDFGIAKLLEGGAAGGLTMTGAGPMTPEYASPEQIRGEPVTTTTDVHALGILLYELLTGRHPFSTRATTARELEAAVLDSDPDSPSTVVTRAANDFDPGQASEIRATSPAALRRELAGDLDNIILKALAKEPGRRYSSAAELSMDLGRYLSGHPILARPATFSYRAGKFLRRNAIAVSIAAGVFATIITATVVSTRAYIRADRMRIEAETQRDRLDEVNKFLSATFEAASPERRQSADEVTARELLDAGAERIEIELADRPEIAATIQTEISRRYFDLGLLERAEELQLAAIERFRATGAIGSPEGATALVYLGATLAMAGKWEDAKAPQREAIELSREFRAGDREIHLESQQRLAEVLYSVGENEESAQIYAFLLDEFSRDPLLDDPEYGERRSSISNDYGLLLERMGDYEEAERQLRHALEIAIAAQGKDHSDVGGIWTNLAFILNRAGKMEEGVASARKGLAIQEKVLGGDHIQVAITRLNLADALVGIGEIEEADPLYPQVLRVFRATYGEEHPRIGTVLNNTAIGLLGENEPERALPMFEEATAIYAKAFGPDHQYTAIGQHNIGRALRQAGRLGEAEQSCRKTLALRRRIFEGDHPDVARSLLLLASILRERGAAGEAEPVLREAVRMTHAELAPEHPVRTGADRALARCLADLSLFDEAEDLFTGVLSLLDSTYGADDERTLRALSELDSIRALR